MSKTKKGRTADKLIDSVLTDLKHDEANDSSSSEEVSNPFLDALRETRNEVPSDSVAPAGLIEKPSNAGEDAPFEKPKTFEATIVAKEEVSPALVDAKPLPPPPSVREDSATMQIEDESISAKTDSTKSASINTNLTDRTQPMGGFRGAQEAPVKAAFGYGKPQGRDISSASSQYSDSQMVQAENLRLAQTRILELENEAEKLRQENELLTAAGTIAKTRLDELTEKIHVVERSKIDAMEHAALEMKILKESLQERDRETAKAKRKVEELEARLNSDLKKIRVRERELENRLELSRLEKTALVRSKDENILDLKRQMDLLATELENYKQRTSELQDKIDNQHDQIGRTVRALRLALTNLESSDTGSDSVLPLKKAE